jgi:hypothetical protein
MYFSGRIHYNNDKSGLKNGEYKNVTREELQVFQQPNKYLDKPDRTTDIKEATLFVKKFDVAPKKTTKFTFYYDGRPISASIQDGQFIQRIQEGEKFGNGDSLIIDLEISKKCDEGYDTYIIDKYTVLNVRDIHSTYIIDKYTVLNVRDIHRRGNNRGDQGDLFQ